MRVVVLGGTKFIGRAVVEELHRRDHDVLVVHRGEHEPDPWVDVEHLHRGRDALSRADVAAFDPDVVVDAYAMSRRDAECGIRAIPSATRCVVLSSMDVYEAYGQLLSGRASQAVPLSEKALFDRPAFRTEADTTAWRTTRSSTLKRSTDPGERWCVAYLQSSVRTTSSVARRSSSDESVPGATGSPLGPDRGCGRAHRG
jgi:uncharacterized protein YbjT (DUF2867 family)